MGDTGGIGGSVDGIGGGLVDGGGGFIFDCAELGSIL